MRQAVIWASLTGSLVVYALTIDLFDSMFMFLLFGILPGRVEPLSANQMLAIYGTATVLICAYAARSTVRGLFRVTTPQRQTRRSAS